MHISAPQSADSRVTTDHCRVTLRYSFYKKFPNCLKRPKTLFDSLAGGRVTSDHCRVTVQQLFSKKFLPLLETSKKRWNFLQSADAVAWPQPLSRDRSATFFKIFPNRLKRPKNVVWQSADGRVTSYHCRMTVQRLFSKKFLIAWNVEKSLFVQSADSRVTSDHCHVTVQRLFSKEISNCLKRRKIVVLTVRPMVIRDLRPLSHGKSHTASQMYISFILWLQILFVMIFKACQLLFIAESIQFQSFKP